MKASRLSQGTKIILSIIPVTVLAVMMAVGAEEKAASSAQNATKVGSMGPQFDKITESLNAVKQSMTAAMGTMSNFNASAESKAKLLDEQIAQLSEVATMCAEDGPIGQMLTSSQKKTDGLVAKLKTKAGNDALEAGERQGYKDALQDVENEKAGLAKNVESLKVQRASLLKNISVMKDRKTYFLDMVEVGQLKLVNKAVSSMVEQMCALNKDIDAVTGTVKSISETVPSKQ
jgi:hypothetical protein